MNHETRFAFVRFVETEETLSKPKQRWFQNKGIPKGSVLILVILILGCFFCDFFLSGDPTYMDLNHYNLPPCREFWFGTDMMGRDIFLMIWYGGRISLFIGFMATLLSTVLAILFGTISGLAPAWLDLLLMRFTELVLSIPNLLLVVFLQAILGKANVVTLSVVIGVTSWASMAKVVRTEVRQLRGSDYILASQSMGAGFFHILWQHLTPNFIPSIMFMVVMEVRGAMLAEATLSFMGLGLPLEVISWGSMLSLSEKAMLTGSWWMILIPGFYLVGTLLCVTEIGNAIRKKTERRESQLR